MMRARLAGITVLALALGSLTACTAAFLDTAAHGIFTQEKTNLTEKNYAVADYLIGQAQTYINRHHDTIRATPLADRNQPEMDSKIGRIIPEQIGVRFSQLGYSVDLASVSTSEDTAVLTPGTKRDERKPDFLLSGSFTRGRSDMDVSLRLIDAANNRVVAAFDYKLPLTRDVNDLAAPQPRIMRMTAPQP
jgi:TolB-like protein